MHRIVSVRDLEETEGEGGFGKEGRSKGPHRRYCLIGSATRESKTPAESTIRRQRIVEI